MLSELREEDDSHQEEDAKGCDIHDGGEHGLGEKRGIFLDGGCSKRKQGADAFGEEDGDAHRDGNQGAIFHRVGEEIRVPAISAPNVDVFEVFRVVDDASILLNGDPQEGEGRHNSSDYRRRTELFP